MHGRVIEAQPQKDGSLALSLGGATMLDESLLPPMVVQQIDRREIVYLAAREGGLRPRGHQHPRPRAAECLSRCGSGTGRGSLTLIPE